MCAKRRKNTRNLINPPCAAARILPNRLLLTIPSELSHPHRLLTARSIKPNRGRNEQAPYRLRPGSPAAGGQCVSRKLAGSTEQCRQPAEPAEQRCNRSAERRAVDVLHYQLAEQQRQSHERQQHDQCRRRDAVLRGAQRGEKQRAVGKRSGAEQAGPEYHRCAGAETGLHPGCGRAAEHRQWPATEPAKPQQLADGREAQNQSL